jgi:hypothetical protein
MKHIAILTHPNDRFAEKSYALAGIAEQWRQNGMKITVVDDPEKRVDADMAILHVDLTVVPDQYLDYMRRYPLVINSAVKDISKRRISSNIVTQGDGYTGPVFVKTDMNCGGAAEGELARTTILGKIVRGLRRRLPWSMRSEINMWDYRVLDSVSQVPRAVWRNSNLVVERFLPERSNGEFLMRSWMFLGDAEENKLMYANQPIIKSPVATRIETCDEIPDELRQMRRDMGFDYGKFDYGVVDGRVILYDANRTPVMLASPQNVPVFRLLASGIDSFFTPQYRAAG